MRRNWLSALILIVATFAAYAPAMRNSFVWDDTALVLRDPLIRSWRLAPHAFREFLFLDATASNFYRPLQRLTYTADYALWGIARDAGEKTGAPQTGDSADIASIQRAPQPGWHFTSVLLHALAALALWRFLTQWLGAGLFPLAGALLWALHPLHTSAVTYVSGRADSIAAAFVFGVLALVVRAMKSGRLIPGDRPASRALIGAALCALGAMLGKESGVAALTLWLVWVLVKSRCDRRGLLVWALSAALACTGYFALRSVADRTPPPPSTPTSLAERPVLAARALAEYATLFVAPHSLHMERDISTRHTGSGPESEKWRRFRALQTAAGAALAALLAWWAWRSRKRYPDVTFAIAAFTMSWLPVSNLFSLNATVAEHWLYVPSAFLLAALMCAARPLFESGGTRAIALRSVTALWFTFLAVQTWRQHAYWRDQQAFVEATIERAGRGARMIVNLAQLAAQRGETARAIGLFRETIAMRPDLAVAHFGIASLALRESDHETALAAVAIAEASPVFTADALVIRAAIAQAQSGQPQFSTLAAAVEAAPRNWSICRRLPLALMAAGKFEAARKDLVRHWTTRPYRAENARMLAQLYESDIERARAENRPDKAETALRFAMHYHGIAANCDVRDAHSRSRLAALRSLRL